MKLITYKDVLSRNDLQLTLLGCVLIAAYLVSWSLADKPLTIFYLCVLGVLCAIVLRHPKTGFYFLVFGLFVFIEAFSLHPLVIGGREIKFYFADFIILFTALSLVWRALDRRFSFKEAFLRFSHLELCLIIFLTLVTITFVRSLLHDSSFFELNFSTFKNYGLYAVVYPLTLVAFHHKQDRDELLSVIWYTGLVILLFVFYGIYRGEGLWADITPLSTFGTRLVSMAHAFYLLVFAVLNLSLLIDRRATNRSPITLFATLSVAMVGFISGLVRHLWIALAGLVAAWFVVVPGKVFKELMRSGVLLFGALLLTVAALYTFFLTAGLETRVFDKAQFALEERFDLSSWFLSGSDTSVGYRFAVWRAAYESFLVSPVFGVGFGAKLIVNDQGFLFTVPVRQAHNFYVGAALQMGLVGLIAVALLLGAIARSLYRHRHRAHNSARFWSGSCVVLFLIASLFNVYWDLNLYIIIFWLFLGVWRLEGGVAPLRIEKTGGLERVSFGAVTKTP